MTTNNSNSKNIELPDEAFSQTRSAAATLICLNRENPEMDVNMAVSQLKTAYPKADFEVVDDLVKGNGAFSEVTDDVINKILSLTHIDGYEVVPYREAVMTVLIRDYLSSLRSPSASLAEDAIQRVTAKLGEDYRGSTKNAAQLVAGQRTRIRKCVRALSLAALYNMHYRNDSTIEKIMRDVEQLLKPYVDDNALLVDRFPVEEFTDNQGVLNERGKFALNETRKFVIDYIPKRDEIDTIIQNSSRKWSLGRMLLIDLSIIRIATYELMFTKDPQPTVYINEAVELSKQFGAERSRNFVNGMLQQIVDDNHLKDKNSK